MAAGRIEAVLSAWRLNRRLAAAWRLEARALAQAGEVLAAAPPPATGSARTLFDRVARANAELAALRDALEASLEADRADYARASSWAGPLVVVRGLAARAVLRDRLARGRRSLVPLLRELGAQALGGAFPELTARVPAVLAGRVAVARAEAEAAAAEWALRLAPLGGRLLPPGLSWVARETAALGRAVARPFRARGVGASPETTVAGALREAPSARRARVARSAGGRT